MAKLDPAEFVAQFYAWAREGPGDISYHVGAKLGVVKIRERGIDTFPWGHGAYSEGGLALGGALARDGSAVSALSGRFVVLFSDRPSHGGECLFAKEEGDIQDITVFEDGNVSIMLRSWGDVVLWLENITCYSEGFLTGVRTEANGESMVTLALRRQSLAEVGRQDWP